jgi:hypothetical protein
MTRFGRATGYKLVRAPSICGRFVPHRSVTDSHRVLLEREGEVLDVLGGRIVVVVENIGQSPIYRSTDQRERGALRTNELVVAALQRDDLLARLSEVGLRRLLPVFCPS